MFRPWLLIAAVLALTLSMTSSASAQFGRGFRIPVSAQNLMMLRNEAVQKELTLTEDQTKSVAELAAKMQSDAMEIMSGLQDLSEEEKKEELPNVMKMITARGKELQEKVDKVLDAKQLTRLKQLSIQRRNMGALEDEEVLAVLKLSDEQKQQLVAIRDGAADKQEEIIKEAIAGGGGDRQAIRGKIEAMQKELGQKALEVLTAEQREQFEKLKGDKFDFPPERRSGF
jgi:Spy/CpxP family protein refolding chaperone